MFVYSSHFYHSTLIFVGIDILTPTKDDTEQLRLYFVTKN